MSLIYRYISREILLSLLAVMVVLFLIIMGGSLTRLLELVAEGRIPADTLPWVLLLGSFNTLLLLMPVSLFLAVMLSLGRLYKDSEMAALRACGVGMRQLYGAIYTVALPLALILSVLVLLLMPVVSQQVEQLRAITHDRSDLAGIVPGRFMQAGVGTGTVIFVESLSADKQRLQGVFIERRVRAGPTQVIRAESGERRIDSSTGDAYLVLVDGYRYEGDPGSADFRIVRFAEHGLRLPEQTEVFMRQRTSMLTTAEIWGSAQLDHRAELQWRLSAPVSLLILALLALPLAHTTPRQGRFAKLALGILVYVLYAQLQISGRSWFAEGVTPAWLGMWWVHAVMLLVALSVLLRQLPLGRGKRLRQRPA